MRLVMMGTGTFAEPTLEALLQGGDPVVGVFTQPDREIGAKRGSTRQIGRGMKEIVQERQIPVFQPIRINAPEGLAMLRDLQPDLLVVAAYGQILSQEVLSVPKLGGINVHASLLPKYRGAAPVAWAIASGESESGVTIIRMSVALDAGDMLDQQSLPILPDETAGELEARLAPLGAAMALASIERLREGAVTGLKQDLAAVTKAPKLKKEDGQIDWQRNAANNHRWIRAMQPWPTAYTFLHRDGKPPLRLQIASAKVTETTTTLPPGSIVLEGLATGHLLVACGQGTSLEILELQPAGKKRMTSMEFLRGASLDGTARFAPEQVQ